MSAVETLKSLESKVSTLVGVIEDNHPGKTPAKALADEIREAIERLEDEGGATGPEAAQEAPAQPEPPKDVNHNVNEPGLVETPNGGSAAPQVNADTNATGPAVPTPPVNGDGSGKKGTK